MPIHDFDSHQQFATIDKLPDPRSDMERLNSLMSVYNHDHPDIAYAERLVEELVNISGGWITIYRRNKKTGNKDEIWEEDADPTYKNGIKIKGKFTPEPAETVLTKWGVEVQNETTVHFARSTVLKFFDRDMIAEGDILIVPHNTLSVVQSTDSRDGPNNRIDTYRVIKSSDTGNFRYRWLYWSCLVQNVTGDASIQVDHKTEHS